MRQDPRYAAARALHEGSQAMITVHHLNNSRSQRILWLLEELGLEYEIKPYQRDPKTMLAPPELRAVHPLGKSPVVSDGERHARRVGRDHRAPRRPLRRGQARPGVRLAGARALSVLAAFRRRHGAAAAAAEAALRSHQEQIAAPRPTRGACHSRQGAQHVHPAEHRAQPGFHGKRAAARPSGSPATRSAPPISR